MRYHESWQERGKKAERWMWLVTTLEQTAPEILWEMMNRRWDIEENGFHQLKTYYHAKHCYGHAAVEVIFNLMIIGFNMRELYLYQRIQRFEESGITRKSVSRMSEKQIKKYGINEQCLRQYAKKIKKNSFRRYFYAVYSRIFRNSMLRYKYVYQPFLQNIEKETIYLSVGGDHYCYGTYSNHIYDFLNDNVLKNGGKSVLWSCSIEEKDLDKRTINSLKQYDLITARESITYQMLLRKGINKNVVLIPDVAFQLSSVKVELPEMLIKGKTIGINISPMIQKYGENGQRVLENYEKLIEFILSETDCTIALIPHVVWNDTDDRIPLTELYKKYKETNRIVLIQDRSAEELKSIIAQCCFFVGARTHATIAAYSSCVPTLVVGYSVKARGIARDIFGTEEEYVIAVQSMKDTFALKRAFEKLWGKKNEIREYLNRTMPQYCEEVLKAKKILETVCESERK